MKYFITGATGFVGSLLTRRLLQEGHIVYALIRPQSLHKKNIDHDNLWWLEGDLNDTETLEEAFQSCDRVFHLAAYAGVWAPDADLFYEVNVLGTRTLLDLALKHDIDRFVYTSTAATLPPSRDEIPTDETDAKMYFFSPYEHTKFLAEEEVKEFSNKGLEVVIVNPTRIFGPGPLSESNSVTRIIQWYLTGKWRFRPGDGSSIGNYVYVRDVVEGHLLAMEHGKSGERYILGGANLSFNELFDTIGEVAGKKRKLISLPQLLMKSFAAFEELRAEFFKARPLITMGWLQKYMHDWNISSEKAQHELGYNITPFQDALRQTIQWLQYTKKEDE